LLQIIYRNAWLEKKDQWEFAWGRTEWKTEKKLVGHSLDDGGIFNFVLEVIFTAAFFVLE